MCWMNWQVAGVGTRHYANFFCCILSAHRTVLCIFVSKTEGESSRLFRNGFLSLRHALSACHLPRQREAVRLTKKEHGDVLHTAVLLRMNIPSIRDVDSYHMYSLSLFRLFVKDTENTA